MLKEKVEWLSTHWKPGVALIYTIICFFDFVIVPAWMGIMRPDLSELLQIISALDMETQRFIIQSRLHHHEPFTLQGAGLFHLSFGAILTGVAFKGKPNE